MLTSTITTDYSQFYLLRRINTYLRQFGRTQLSERGYCHGLVLVWLQKMSEGTENESFYAPIKKIINTPFVNIKSLEDDIAVQKFIAQIEYAQRSYVYTGLAQKYVAEIMEAKEKLYRKEYFSTKKFSELMDETLQDRHGMAVTAFTDYTHTQGIFLRNGVYHLLDSNYEEGEAHCFDTSMKTSTEMLKRFHEPFNIPQPQWVTLELSVIDAQLKKQKKHSITEVSLFSKPLEMTVEEEETINLEWNQNLNGIIPVY